MQQVMNAPPGEVTHGSGKHDPGPGVGCVGYRRAIPASESLGDAPRSYEQYPLTKSGGGITLPP